MPAALANVKQGDELTIVLEGRMEESRFSRRLLVADLLPPGSRSRPPSPAVKRTSRSGRSTVRIP